jgi:hypothetical protein
MRGLLTERGDERHNTSQLPQLWPPATRASCRRSVANEDRRRRRSATPGLLATKARTDCPLWSVTRGVNPRHHLESPAAHLARILSSDSQPQSEPSTLTYHCALLSGPGFRARTGSSRLQVLAEQLHPRGTRTARSTGRGIGWRNRANADRSHRSSAAARAARDAVDAQRSDLDGYGRVHPSGSRRVPAVVVTYTCHA